MATIWLVSASTAPLGRRERRKPPGRALELRQPDRLGAGSERRDRRNDVESAPPLEEALALLRDDQLGLYGLFPPARDARVDDALQVVDVVEVAAV